jgi:hypothetical protein
MVHIVESGGDIQQKYTQPLTTPHGVVNGIGQHEHIVQSAALWQEPTVAWQ